MNQPPGNRLFRDRLSWRSPIALTIAIAVIVNVVLLAAWLWSRGGQTTDVRFEAQADEFNVWLDGDHLVGGRFPSALAEGRLVLQMDTTDAIPSLPEPRGVDYVLVRDIYSGEVLFEEDFSDPLNEQQWTGVRGAFEVKDGHLGATLGPGVLILNEPVFSDVRVDVRFHNITAGSVVMRHGTAEDSNVIFEMRPFRHYDAKLAVRNDSVPGRELPARVEVDEIEVLQSMVATLLSFVPWIYLLIGIAFVAVFGLQFFPAVGGGLLERWRSTDGFQIAQFAPLTVAAFIATLAFAVTLWLMVDYNAAIPHVPDEVSYLFQAKVLASGRFTAPAPPAPESFAFFFPPLIVAYQGDWFSVYPFGHTSVLAIGQVFGIPWIMPPLVGALAVVATFIAGREIWNTRTGLLAAALLALSPFFLMTASNFMSHNTAALYITLSVLFLALREKKPIPYSIASGICFGLLFNTRPLTAVALVPPFALLFVVFFFTGRSRWKDELRQHAAWGAAALLLLAASGAYNWATTGDPFMTGYSASGDVSEVIGFGGKHSVALGIQNEQVQLSMLTMVLHNWPLWLGMALVVLPFVLGTRKLWDWFLLACAVAVLAVYTLYEAPGIMHGPRYWFEAVPFLVLLAARGADLLAARLAEAANAIRRSLFDVDRPPTWAGVVVVYGFVLVLAIAGSRDWLVGNGGGWIIDKMPARAKELRDFNGASDRSLKAVEDADLENALVLAQASTSWQSYGTLFWKNSPDLDGNIIYAKDIPAKNAELFALYPDRRVYFSDYQLGVLVPYGVVPNAMSTFEPEEAPLARAVPTPTIAPTPTPDIAGIARRDELRRADLDTLTRIIGQYHDATGEYPPAVNVQSICVYEFDSGCVLKQIQNPLPTDPLPGGTYWYHSDGATFYYVVACMEGTPGDSNCPDPFPPAFGDRVVYYCLRGP